jgi:hypothetical protein
MTGYCGKEVLDNTRVLEEIQILILVRKNETQNCVRLNLQNNLEVIRK